MKMKNTFTVPVVLLISLLVSPSYGKDFAHKQQLNRRSKEKILDVGEVSVLIAKKGAGNTSVMNSLLKKFRNHNKFGMTSRSIDTSISEYGADLSFTRGDGWNLMSFGDGTRVSFMNEKLLKTNEGNRKQPISAARLEKIGRDFIRENLSDYVVLGDNEELVAFHSIDEVDSVHTDEADVESEESVASIIIFSRRINGIDVIGRGSKVSVTFTNDETPVGFDFDWPVYAKSSTVQKIVSKKGVADRLSALGTTKGGVKNLSVTRFECGYFDPGQPVRNHDSDYTVQSACSAFYDGEIVDSNGRTAPYSRVDFVPIADVDTIEYDETWPQAARLFDEGEQCRNTDVTSVWLSELAR